jgi:hypothetical protein
MDFQMIPVTERIDVEGESEHEGVGAFAGRVVAIAFQGGDPVGAPVQELSGGAETATATAPEGLRGWGTTYFLVVDGDHPSPVWVPKDDVEKTTLG